MSDDKKLYRFFWDMGRIGTVRGFFTATEEEINKAIGQKVYLGEVLGKHSEIHGELREEDLIVLTEDQEFIQKAEKYGLVPFGCNPLDYIEKDEEE